MNEFVSKNQEDASDIMVSVTMLSYNHEQYIEQALNSVLSQKTNFAFEILIGDDASTDHSRDILRRYAQQYPQIRLFEREENLGTTRNAYLLLTQARGKYLASCESDDFWLDEQKLQKQVDFLEKNPEYIGCSHNVVCVNLEGNRLPSQRVFWISKKKIFRLKDFKGVFLPGHSSSIVRKNIFLNPEYDYSIFYQAHPFVGDRTIAMLYLAQGDFFHMKEQMSCYRRNFTQSSSSVTSTIYKHDGMDTEDELEFIRRLEHYGQSVLHVNIWADYYRREMLAAAFWRCLVHPSTRSRTGFFQILHALHNPLLGCILIPYNVVKKFTRKYILKNDR